jgi:hypothetical protein
VILDPQRLRLARWALDRRMIIAAVLIILVNLVMMITLVHLHWFGRVIAVVGVIFLVLVIFVRKEAASVPIWFIVAVSIAVQIPDLFLVPRTSDDAYRYVWDGRVLLAGIDPYQFVPADPALVQLRDPVLFPDGQPPLINRPGVPTIYPPIAQLWFAPIAFITPWAVGTLGVQIAAAVAVVVTTWLLARFLGDRRGWSLLYGACHLRAVCFRAWLGRRPATALAGRCLSWPGGWHQAGSVAADPGLPATWSVAHRIDWCRHASGVLRPTPCGRRCLGGGLLAWLLARRGLRRSPPVRPARLAT